MDLETRIRRFVTEELLYDREVGALGADDSLLGPGLLDSVAILRLVSWMEEEFGVTIADEEVVPDNLETLGRLGALVRRKQGAA